MCVCETAGSILSAKRSRIRFIEAIPSVVYLLRSLLTNGTLNIGALQLHWSRNKTTKKLGTTAAGVRVELFVEQVLGSSEGNDTLNITSQVWRQDG